jgi:hypothetical protein
MEERLMPNNNPTGKNQYSNRKAGVQQQPQQQPQTGNQPGNNDNYGGQRVPESD